MTRAPARTCNVCGGDALHDLATVEGVPILANRLYDTEADARAAQFGSLRLAHCGDCDHLFNLAFDSEAIAYGPDYENALHFSPRFEKYAESLVAELDARYALRGKEVVEVGCGDGRFLTALCRDVNRGVGFDPGYREPQSRTTPGAVTFHAAFASETLHSLNADLLCARHCLEHVDQPVRWLAEVMKAARCKEGAGIYVEVPNASFMFRHRRYWDLVYEHVSYFTPRSLATAAQSAGIEVVDIQEGFDGQFLKLHGRAHLDDRRRPLTSRPEPVGSAVGEFARRLREEFTAWSDWLDVLHRENRRVALWGMGTKGITFLNLCDRTRSIRQTVDVNPRKHGRYVAGAGVQVMAPSALASFDPDILLVANAIYAEEVRAQCRALGLHESVVCL